MIKAMLTKTDLSNLKKTFVTKDEFYSVLNEVDQRFNQIEQTMNTKFDLVMTALDSVMHELQAMREEMTVFAYRQAEHSDQLVNLNKKMASFKSN